jgi:hypothetical protein
VTEFRPHWSQLLKEGLLVVAAIVLGIFIGIAGLPGWLIFGLVGLVVVLIANG